MLVVYSVFPGARGAQEQSLAGKDGLNEQLFMPRILLSCPLSNISPTRAIFKSWDLW